MAPPQPVYRPDTQLAELKTAENLLVLTLRLFALACCEPDGRYPDWRDGLRVGNLPGCTPAAFESLLRVVVAAARRPLDVRRLECPRLGYDEARLLQIVSLLQHRRRAAAEAVLESWVPPAACRLAISPAMGLAAALRLADLVVPLRPCAPMAVPSHQLHANPGLGLVH